MVPLLQVFDMPTSFRFYRDVLGFEVVSDSGGGDRADWVWFRHGEVHLMLNTAYEADDRPDSPDAARLASHEDTGLFFSCRDLDDLYERLTHRGVQAERPKTAPYGMRQLYAKDPDGYVLCFQWPTDDETGARWRAGSGGADAGVTAVIAELEQQLARAWVARDRARIASLLAPEWTVTDPAGRILTTQAVLDETFASDERQIETMEVEEVEVRLLGDVAVATGRTRATGRYQGQRASVVLRFTDVWWCRDDRWQVVASQGTLVAS
jgi:catechol 2,3-dioxygenase-like lactoylglutathione lyase family enzyme